MSVLSRDSQSLVVAGVPLGRRPTVGKACGLPLFIAGGHVGPTLCSISFSRQVSLYASDIPWSRGRERVAACRRSHCVNHPPERSESVGVQIVDFLPEHGESFRQMNLDWINHYWEVEDADRLFLDHPQEKILDPGGAILMAIDDGEPVGAVALVPMGEGSYEFAKMAVDERARGKGIGWLLGTALLERAREVGATRVYLESNTILEPAINLYKKLGFETVQGGASPYDRCNIQMEVWLT
ncbi:MAG TPA: GNAT family N-acetyltransferase [Gemmatimonadetes bacterium]|nr:GNAT family N-acetyltransferase [Gemmatimonadota bacterium]